MGAAPTPKTRVVVWAITLCMIAAVVASSFTSASAQAPGAARVVNAFYAWHFANKQDWTKLSSARQYFTPSLYASLAKVLAIQESAHEEVLDYNPFIHAQIEAQSYTTGRASGSGSTLSVPVNLRFKDSSGVSVIRVIVVQRSGEWKIDNLVYPGYGDLRSALRDALK